jgi:hypothetical protein
MAPLQAGGALAIGDQKSQEHAKRRRALFRRGPPALATGLQDKLSQAPSIEPAWLFSKASEQPANRADVVPERAITGTPLLAHPLTEGCEESRILNAGFDRVGRDDARPSQVSQEQVCAVDQVPTVTVAVAWASAAAQVTLETLERLLAQPANSQACSLGPIDEMLCRSDVSAGRDLGVAASRQLVGETFEEGPCRTTTKFVNPRW